ncbi:hypothetical protein ACFL1A_01470 [Patescibacteria group bacterium]
MFILRYFVVIVVFTILSTVISVGWPKYIGSSRPQVIEQVHNVVKDTPLAQNTASVLGISDEKNIEPIDYRILARDTLSGGVGVLEKKVTQIVAHQTFVQIISNIDKMNENQIETIREVVCEEKKSE